MRAAIYARVSSSEASDRQDAENQIEQLKQFARSQGWELIDPLYVDHVSGAKGKDKRPQLRRLLHEASQRRFDILLVWSTDRLTREGPHAALDYVKTLSQYGVCFRSFQQPFLDTCGTFGEVLLALFGWLASEERRLISQRTKAALARLKQQGVKLGRKPVAVNLDMIQGLRARGESLRTIAHAAGASVGTIHSILRSTKGDKSRQVSTAISAAV
jgi:DNA invertase Pin-like site-specific DNA recombinase